MYVFIVSLKISVGGGGHGHKTALHVQVARTFTGLEFCVQYITTLK